METGRRDQWLICEGWFASHADSGTPGPHLHLRTSDGQEPVLRTDQVPNLAEALTVVATRIDRMWALHGDEYAEKVVLRSPDPQDPEVTRLLARAASTDEALISIGALLGVAEAEVMYRLARVDMLSLTRAAYERRVRLLDESEA